MRFESSRMWKLSVSRKIPWRNFSNENVPKTFKLNFWIVKRALKNLTDEQIETEFQHHSELRVYSNEQRMREVQIEVVWHQIEFPLRFNPSAASNIFHKHFQLSHVTKNETYEKLYAMHSCTWMGKPSYVVRPFDILDASSNTGQATSLWLNGQQRKLVSDYIVKKTRFGWSGMLWVW